jgi:hypothetical protein
MKIGQVPPGLEVTLINSAAGERRRWTKARIVSDLVSLPEIYEPAVSTVNIWEYGINGGVIFVVPVRFILTALHWV